MIYEHVPYRAFATPNTVQRGYHRYVTNLDIAVDKVALENGELSHVETVGLVNYLTEIAYRGGRRDAVQR